MAEAFRCGQSAGRIFLDRTFQITTKVALAIIALGHLAVFDTTIAYVCCLNPNMTSAAQAILDRISHATVQTPRLRGAIHARAFDYEDFLYNDAALVPWA
ncbi:Long chain acyl-CoA synthetase 6, peroxisomal [Sphaceloma murrayae]|uniref:Long chain acyl-CoA synthetase 6, peroxisomal n=1 Tax=Sphaceloma murrayae TaxID=2082308 RepID=A0A2K1QJ09_9PEZI|nr:Long chain acyl-CoA synthetase 6, peroxisomal [Sphaceloma murrayae]